jgi:hypothetical protein
MAKNTRPLSGAIQRKYFRDLLRSDPGVTAEAAERLSDTLSKEVAQIRVRLPMAVRRAAPAGVAKAAVAVAAPSTAPPAKAGETPPAEPAPAFDPHAFSLIVELRKGGKTGFVAKLKSISDDAQLKAIAKAQHVAIEGEPADRDGLIAAILAGTERRVAHRYAAAS